MEEVSLALKERKRQEEIDKKDKKNLVLGQIQGSGMSSVLQNHTLKNKFEYEY